MKNKQKKTNPTYSVGYKKFLAKKRGTTALVIFLQLFIIIAFVLLWEILATKGIIDSFIFSSPSRIIRTIKSFSASELWLHVSTTLYETLLGFLIATLLGTIIAVLLWFSKTARRVLEPYLVVLNSLPKIALGPMLIIWFGVGSKSIVAMCVLICIILTTISMLNAFCSIEEEKITLMKSMGANKMQILFKLVLPASIPPFLSVLKVNVGMSMVGSIMGEYISSKAGLGYLIIYGGQVFDLDLVMASTVILCFLAALMYFAVALLEKLATRKQKRK